jgi:glycosyltransferase involved in cell wall biosynthesis
MKIVIVSRNHIFDIPGGGGEVTMHEYAHNLAKMGNEVTMLVTKPSNDKLDIEKVEDRYTIRRYKSFRKSLVTTLPKLIKEVRELKPDVVIMTSFADATVGYFIQKRTGVNVIALAHDEFNIYGFRPPFNLFFWINRKFFAGRIHKIVAVNHNVARAVQRELDYYPQVAYTGFGEPEERTVSDKKYTFCFVGRFFIEKGMNYLAEAVIEVAKQHPHINCVFVGCGAYLDEFKEKYKEQIKSGLFITTGYLSNGDLDIVLRSSEVFVNPTYANEGIVFTNLQAMRKGTPVITTNVGATTEAVRDWVNGFVVNPRSVVELKFAMTSMLDMDKDKKEQMIEKGIETSNFFTGEKATERLWKVLNE